MPIGDDVSSTSTDVEAVGLSVPFSIVISRSSCSPSCSSGSTGAIVRSGDSAGCPGCVAALAAAGASMGAATTAVATAATAHAIARRRARRPADSMVASVGG